MKRIVIAVCAAAAAGCSALPIPVGNESLVEPSEQRAAVTGVRVTDTVPEGAPVIGTVTAQRCHRNSFDTPPGQLALLIDLQVSAYAAGASGIGNVTYDSKGLSSLGQNCWKIYTAEGIAYGEE